SDMVDNGTHSAALGRWRPRCLVQNHQHARETHGFKIAAFDFGAAHGKEDLLVGSDIAAIEMPMSHGHARLIRRKRLCPRCPCGQTQNYNQTQDRSFHLLLLSVARWELKIDY